MRVLWQSYVYTCIRPFLCTCTRVEKYTQMHTQTVTRQQRMKRKRNRKQKCKKYLIEEKKAERRKDTKRKTIDRRKRFCFHITLLFLEIDFIPSQIFLFSFPHQKAARSLAKKKVMCLTLDTQARGACLAAYLKGCWFVGD